MRKLFFPIALAALSSLALVAVACGGDDDDDDTGDEEAAADLCGELDELATALGGVASLTAESTVDEAEEALAAVNDEVDDLGPAAQDVAEDRADELDSAYEDLDEAVSRREGEETLGDAATEVQQAAAGVAAAREELFTSAGCGA
jgi:hypothetical protein